MEEIETTPDSDEMDSHPIRVRDNVWECPFCGRHIRVDQYGTIREHRCVPTSRSQRHEDEQDLRARRAEVDPEDGEDLDQPPVQKKESYRLHTGLRALCPDTPDDGRLGDVHMPRARRVLPEGRMDGP